MEKHIYKFLDSYIGYEAKSIRNLRRANLYKIVSSDGITICEFSIHDDNKISIFRSKGLCETVSNFFDVSEQVAAKHIRNWFGDVHNLKKVGDITKFIV